MAHFYSKNFPVLVIACLLCGLGSAPANGFQHSPVSSRALNKQQQQQQQQRTTSLQSAGERRERSSLAAVNEQQDNIKTGTAGWAQRTITVTAPSRGCHLITSEISKQVPELRSFRVGMANIFLKHTSASLTINENADPDVRTDMESALNR
ncbi:unnamed protein product, partial [Ectocarpus sp. 12 AP-2014]